MRDDSEVDNKCYDSEENKAKKNNYKDTSNYESRCNQCNTTFKDFQAAVNHLCKPHKCESCLETFLFDYQLKMHKCAEKNTDKKETSEGSLFKCSCDSTFETLDLLSQHKIVCFKNKTKGCDICRKRFSSRYNGSFCKNCKKIQNEKKYSLRFKKLDKSSPYVLDNDVPKSSNSCKFSESTDVTSRDESDKLTSNRINMYTKRKVVDNIKKNINKSDPKSILNSQSTVVEPVDNKMSNCNRSSHTSSRMNLATKGRNHISGLRKNSNKSSGLYNLRSEFSGINTNSLTDSNGLQTKMKAIFPEKNMKKSHLKELEDGSLNSVAESNSSTMWSDVNINNLSEHTSMFTNKKTSGIKTVKNNCKVKDTSQTKISDIDSSSIPSDVNNTSSEECINFNMQKATNISRKNPKKVAGGINNLIPDNGTTLSDDTFSGYVDTKSKQNGDAIFEKRLKKNKTQKIKQRKGKSNILIASLKNKGKVIKKNIVHTNLVKDYSQDIKFKKRSLSKEHDAKKETTQSSSVSVDAPRRNSHEMKKKVTFSLPNREISDKSVSPKKKRRKEKSILFSKAIPNASLPTKKNISATEISTNTSKCNTGTKRLKTKSGNPKNKYFASSKDNEQNSNENLTLDTVLGLVSSGNAATLMKISTNDCNSFRCIKCYKLFKQIKTAARHFHSCKFLKRSILFKTSDLEFICLNCYFRCGKYSDLTVHHECCTSSTNFNSKTESTIADRIQHYENKKNICAKCSFSCLNSYAFSQHECEKRLEKMKTCIVGLKKLTECDLNAFYDLSKLQCSSCEAIFYDDVTFEKHAETHLNKGVRMAKVLAKNSDIYARKEKKTLIKKSETFQSVAEIIKEFVEPVSGINSVVRPEDVNPDLNLDATMPYENQKLLADAAKPILSESNEASKDILKGILKNTKLEGQYPFEDEDSDSSKSETYPSDHISIGSYFKCRCKNTVDPNIEAKPCMKCLDEFLEEYVQANLNKTSEKDQEMESVPLSMESTSAVLNDKLPNDMDISFPDSENPFTVLASSSNSVTCTSKDFDISEPPELLSTISPPLETESDNVSSHCPVADISHNCVSSIISEFSAISEKMQPNDIEETAEEQVSIVFSYDVKKDEETDNLRYVLSTSSDNNNEHNVNFINDLSALLRPARPEIAKSPDIVVHTTYHWTESPESIVGPNSWDQVHTFEMSEPQDDFAKILIFIMEHKTDFNIYFEIICSKKIIKVYIHSNYNLERSYSAYAVRATKLFICSACVIDLPPSELLQHLIEVHKYTDISLIVM